MKARTNRFPDRAGIIFWHRCKSAQVMAKVASVLERLGLATLLIDLLEEDEA